MPDKNSLLSVPQQNNNWYVFHELLRAWIAEEDQEPFRPTLVAVLDAGSQIILKVELLQAPPGADEILEIISSTITDPQHKRIENHRPKAIKFEDKQLIEALSADLAELGISARYVPNRKMSRAIMRDFEKRIQEERIELEGLASKTGVTPQILDGFYQAAAEFFRAEPWAYLSDSEPLMIHVSSHEPHYVSILGQGGMEYGMVVFMHQEEMDAFMLTILDEYPDIPAGGWYAFNFEEKYQIPFDDLDDLELHGYEIAAPNAYPMPATYYSSGRVERPTKEMICWYQAAMQAISRFVEIYFKSEESAPVEETSFQFEVMYGDTPIDVEVGYPLS